MERITRESYRLRAADCDFCGRMRLDALFRLMQEGSEANAAGFGASHADLLQKGLFFALARVHLVQSRIPEFGQTIVHETWPGTPNRFFFPRYHRFTLADDGSLLTAVGSLWVTLDTQAHSIVTPEKSGLRFPDTSDIPAPVSLPLRLPHLKDGERRAMTRAPMFSDYDLNGHVNNTRYMGWLCDMLGNGFFSGRYIAELTAGYEKEVRGQDQLTLQLQESGDVFSFDVSSVGDDGCAIRHFYAVGTTGQEPADE